LDTESYELLEKIPGSSLVGKKWVIFYFCLSSWEYGFCYRQHNGNNIIIITNLYFGGVHKDCNYLTII
jgi:hypothetical protein